MRIVWATNNSHRPLKHADRALSFSTNRISKQNRTSFLSDSTNNSNSSIFAFALSNCSGVSLLGDDAEGDLGRSNSPDNRRVSVLIENFLLFSSFSAASSLASKSLSTPMSSC